MAYRDNESEFVAVLSRRIPAGRQANALGHMTAGLLAKMGDSSSPDFAPYPCADDDDAPPLISRYPFVVLSAKNPSQLRALRHALTSFGLVSNAFYGQMMAASHDAQLSQTRSATDDQLDYWGLVCFGPKSVIDPLVRKFSLYRGQAAGL